MTVEDGWAYARGAMIGGALLALAGCAGSRETPPTGAAVLGARCARLARPGAVAWPDASTRVESARLNAADGAAPAHCEVVGFAQPHKGVDGQDYRIRFHVRLPLAWNSRFFFQGGGGSNGVLGDATGRIVFGEGSALQAGYAVASQDSGHDDARNSVPALGGAVAFGFDPIARANYGHASLKVSAEAAKAVIESFYGRPEAYAYFDGCSKGGQEGMAFAQRYPEIFDGILASDPGFALPKAAVAEAWDTQTFARLAPGGAQTAEALARTFSDADLALVGAAVTAACDRDDGLADGMVLNLPACTTGKVRLQLEAHRCAVAKAEGCLSPAQIEALLRVFAGPRNTRGEALYADWPWDPGVGASGWRMWKLGAEGGRMPAANVTLGMPSLGAVFSTPPRGVPDPAAAFAFAQAFDFDRDAQAIHVVAAPFTTSSWTDIAARSPDLDRFHARGGKLIVPHGSADPVFSLNDTLSWYREVRARAPQVAAQSVRVFPVPGLAHCFGGPATGEVDAFGALVDWVEHGRAPDRLLATAGPQTPWPGRTRPLCAYPAMAMYRGGDPEKAASFRCERPKAGAGPGA